MCIALAELCRHLFSGSSCCRRGAGKTRKRPEAFLTPYEMDMVPLMLKELDDYDHRFYQMVCYRWFKEARLLGNQMASATSVCDPSACTSSNGVDQNAGEASILNGSLAAQQHQNNNHNNLLFVANGTSAAPTLTTTPTTTNNSNSNNVTASTTTLTSTSTQKTLGFDEFVSEGLALRHLIRFLSKTLRNGGTFDEECETQLAAYRAQRQCWTQRVNNAGVTDRAPLGGSASPSIAGTLSASPMISHCGSFYSADHQYNAVNGTSNASSTASRTRSYSAAVVSAGSASKSKKQLRKKQQPLTTIDDDRPATTVDGTVSSTSTQSTASITQSVNVPPPATCCVGNASSMKTPLLNVTGTDDIEQPLTLAEDSFNNNNENNNNKGVQRNRPATMVIPAVTVVQKENNNYCQPNNSVHSKNGGKTDNNKMKRLSKKERRAAAAAVDALFVQLGEILIHQFHSTITVDWATPSGKGDADNFDNNANNTRNGKTNNNVGGVGIQPNENVHERELKVLIWRHFAQMLVTVLTDRARFPA